MRKGMRWTMFVAVGFLALVGVGASAAHYLRAPYNPGFLEFPVATALHVILGGVYLALAPFQFAKRIRSRHLGYHRWAGRVLVPIGLLVGEGGRRVLRAPVPLSPRQGLSPRPRRKGGHAPGVGDPGLRHSARHRHDAPYLRPRAADRGHSHRWAGRDACYRIVHGSVRRARLAGGGLDPRHPEEERFRGRCCESRVKAEERRAALRYEIEGVGGEGSRIRA